MGFILDGLDTESYDREYSDRDLLRRIVSYFRPYGRKMALVAIMLTLNSVAGSGRPIIIDFIIEPEANVFPMVPPGAGIMEMVLEDQEETKQ